MKKRKRKAGAGDKEASTEVFLESASLILEKTGASAIMVYVDSLPDIDAISVLPQSVPLILVTRNPDASGVPEGVRAKIAVPAFDFTRVDQIKLAAVLGLARGVLKAGEKVVCLTGAAGEGKLDMLMVLEIGAEFEIFKGHGSELLASDVNPEVLVRVIDIAAHLSLEGREGKAVGTCFVVGNEEKVLAYTRQMTINPFRGYPEEERNILSPALEETIKEFASIDGAFVVRGDGVIVTAGAYLQPPGSEKPLEPGLGARHAAAAAITEAVDTIAITLSESTGTVRLYQKGSVIVAVARPTGPAVSSKKELSP